MLNIYKRNDHITLKLGQMCLKISPHWEVDRNEYRKYWEEGGSLRMRPQ